LGEPLPPASVNITTHAPEEQIVRRNNNLIGGKKELLRISRQNEGKKSLELRGKERTTLRGEGESLTREPPVQTLACRR